MGSIVLPAPRGASSFTLTYTTPGLDIGRVIFWVGLAGIALTLVVPRRRDESRYAAVGATGVPALVPRQRTELGPQPQ